MKQKWEIKQKERRKTIQINIWEQWEKLQNEIDTIWKHFSRGEICSFYHLPPPVEKSSFYFESANRTKESFKGHMQSVTGKRPDGKLF